MKTAQIVLLSIVLAILLTMLILWCAEVLAHGEGKCIELSNGEHLRIIHFTPNGEDDPSRYPKPDYDGGHGHIKETLNGEMYSWGYWTAGGYEFVENDESEFVECQASPSPQPATPPPIALVLDDLIEDEITEESDSEVEFESDPPPKPEPVPESEPEPMPCTTVWISFDLESGFNLFHLPIQVTDVQTVGELHKALGITGDLVIYSYDGTDWYVYSGEMDRGTLADAELGVYTGLVVRVDTSASVSMRGCPLSTSEPLTLQPGLNIVGFPTPPPGVTLVSDLLGLNESICAVVTEIDGELFTVGRAGDPGDGEMVSGQAYLVIATETITLEGF